MNRWDWNRGELPVIKKRRRAGERIPSTMQAWIERQTPAVTEINVTCPCGRSVIVSCQHEAAEE